jgi:predicted RNA-binding Zn ribbon-like protein
MSEPKQYLSNLELIGGKLCLNFANSVVWRASATPSDLLSSYSDLVTWSTQTGAISKDKALHLIKKAQLAPLDASMVFEQAISLREAIYQIFSAIAANHPIDFGALNVLNSSLSEALKHRQVIPTTDGFTWNWFDCEDKLDSTIWSIATSAGELLVSQELDRVRECLGEGCGWLFLDESRSRSRRWCDMNICGNRAKANRYYHRHTRD